jgi:hypothetical protein
VFDLLRDNGLEGLLYTSSLNNDEPVVSGDTLHLNDVEVFRSGTHSDVFAPGDIMFSLRNLSSIFVIDPETRRIKFSAIGRFMRQHDPDFDGGNKISVFDNRNLMPYPASETIGSRVIEIDAATGMSSILIDGRGETPFFTATMGTHQKLANGNMLVNPAEQGRVLEFLPDGRLAWRFDNRFGHDINGLVTAAEVLPPEMGTAFFKTLAASCQ